MVDPGVTTLQQTFQQLFPGEDIRVAMNEESIILTGSVSSNAVMLRAGEIADGHVEQDRRHQHAAAARRLGEPAGDAAGPRRGGQPPRDQGARRQLLLARVPTRRAA